jgi:tetratricopeptide (TPR) repeat protein
VSGSTIPTPVTLSLDEATARAVISHREGRLAEAEAIYRAILQVAPRHFDALHLLGVIRHQQGRHEEALVLIEKALEQRPASAEACSNLGLALQALGRSAEALACFERAIALRPDYPEALNNRGTALHALGRTEEALTSFDQALALRPDYLDVLVNRGVALARLGRHAEALASYERALALQPDRPELLARRGHALYALRRHAEAFACYRRVLELRPESASAHHDLGVTLHALERDAEALASHDRAVELQPDFAAAWNDRGIALDALERHEEAVASYDRALAIQPDLAAAHNNRSNALLALDLPEEAVAGYERTLAVAPDLVEAHTNRGIALHRLNRLEEALASYGRALELRPDHVDAFDNQGATLYRLNRRREAVDSYSRALALRPDDAEAHWHRGMIRLSLGEWGEGWRGYEWRWRAKTFTSPRRGFAQPQWGGEDLGGRRVLLHGEQGLGDTLQFARFVPHVAARGGRVLLEVQEPVAGLLAGLPGSERVLARNQPLPDFDLHCPLLSLPMALGTTLENLPAEVPYLAAPGPRALRWRERLGETARPRIGLVWAGSRDHRNDHNRSMPLETLLPLAALNDVELVSLQKELRESDRETLLASRIQPLGEELDDFEDTAAVVGLLDLVIAVDTAVAHLAGALARPVWILLPFSPDWRWMLDREDTPWYPTARLFRQTRPGDWSGLVERVAEALGEAWGTVR